MHRNDIAWLLWTVFVISVPILLACILWVLWSLRDEARVRGDDG